MLSNLEHGADATLPFQIDNGVFLRKFWQRNAAAIEGVKLTVDFYLAGQQKVIDSFVRAACP